MGAWPQCRGTGEPLQCRAPLSFFCFPSQLGRESLSFSFTVERDIPVRGLKPAQVKVYDYYETGECQQCPWQRAWAGHTWRATGALGTHSCPSLALPPQPCPELWEGRGTGAEPSMLGVPCSFLALQGGLACACRQTCCSLCLCCPGCCARVAVTELFVPTSAQCAGRSCLSSPWLRWQGDLLELPVWVALPCCHCPQTGLALGLPPLQLACLGETGDAGISPLWGSGKSISVAPSLCQQCQGSWQLSLLFCFPDEFATQEYSAPCATGRVLLPSLLSPSSSLYFWSSRQHLSLSV